MTRKTRRSCALQPSRFFHYIDVLVSYRDPPTRPSRVFALPSKRLSQSIFVFEYCCLGLPGPFIRLPDSGLFADIDPDSMSSATSATGYCRA
ncbi:unnamed protein product [Lasius platythorax]|uniref:Uncharacterized protein n=1 Tax=Lasius platythorax TaxID=488582 RepID=A0AAV2NDF5_9HYME